MDEALYTHMAATEDRHWWFGGRRAIVENVIRRLDLPAEGDILDAGCGTGGNLQMLARHGCVFGCELNDGALHLAQQRGIGKIDKGFLPDGIPFGGQRFDMVVLTDVLEHIEDDRATLAAIHDRLKPGGYALVTVPALPWLWTPRDEAHHHYRRYVKRGLRQLAQDVGFTVPMISYFNTWLFPLIAPLRLWQRLGNRPYQNDLAVPAQPVNRALEGLFASERFVVGRAPLPLGVSLIMAARKSAVSEANAPNAPSAANTANAPSAPNAAGA